MPILVQLQKITNLIKLYWLKPLKIILNLVLTLTLTMVEASTTEGLGSIIPLVMPLHVDYSEFMGKMFQVAQLTHGRYWTIDHSCKIFF